MTVAPNSRFCPKCLAWGDYEPCTLHDQPTPTFHRAQLGPADLVFAVGTVLAGRYRIVGRLGGGGYGQVYLGEHVAIAHQRVAIKVLAVDMSAPDDPVRRFCLEARVTSSLRHGNTVRLIDIGQAENGAMFMVMELVEGRTFSETLRQRGVVAEPEIRAVAIEVLKSLQEAHAAGMVHRDLKPANIMFGQTVDGELSIKVLDFGIAYVKGSSLTGQGTALGTPDYMSPEQCMGMPVDARADLYSLGVILFQAVTGNVPFRDPNPLRTMFAHANEPLPDVSALARTPLSRDFVAIVHKALAKQPEERFASARDMRLTLEQLPTGPIAVPPPGRPLGTSVPSQLTPSTNGFAVPAGHADEVALAPTQLHSPATRQNLASADDYEPLPKSGNTKLVVALLAGLAAFALAFLALRKHDATPPVAKPKSIPVAAKPVVPPPQPQVAAPIALANPWVAIHPPAPGTILGLPSDHAGTLLKGFRPARKAPVPTRDFSVQAFEVTWSELGPWLSQSAWKVTAPPNSERLPATGLPWAAAMAYCQQLGATLPTEAQWETAARGATWRPHAWGDAPLDLAQTLAFAGESATLWPVGKSTQDVTPEGVHDLTGNAREWTADLWREDRPADDATWIDDGVNVYRAVRGLDPAAKPPARLPSYSAAWREPLCAAGPCLAKATARLEHVGFRCVK